MENTPLPPLTAVEKQIIDMKVDGSSNKAIAATLDITPSSVSYIIAKPNIRSLINETIQASYEATKAYRVNLLAKTIESKLEQMENDDKELGDMTKKDIVDLVSILDNLLKEEEKATLGKEDNKMKAILAEITDA